MCVWAVSSPLLCSAYAPKKSLFEQHPTLWSQVPVSEFMFYSRAQKLGKVTHGYFEGKNQDSECDEALFKLQLSFFFHLGQVQKHHQVLCSDRAVGRPVQLLYSHSDHHGDNPAALSQRDRGAARHPLRLAVRMPCSEVHTMNIAQKPSCLIWSFMMEEVHNASLIFSVHCLIH